MKTRLLPLAAWAAFLASAISEWGFDIDFPLVPALWLVIAVFTFFAANAHAAINGNGVVILPRPVAAVCDRRSDSALTERRYNISCCAPVIAAARSVQLFVAKCWVRGSDGGVIVTASDAIPAVIFLSPAVTRGPPGSDNQIDRTPGRPARHLYAASLPSETHLHDSSTTRIAFLNGTGQTPSRSAIEGDQT